MRAPLEHHARAIASCSTAAASASATRSATCVEFGIALRAGNSALRIADAVHQLRPSPAPVRSAITRRRVASQAVTRAGAWCYTASADKSPSLNFSRGEVAERLKAAVC